MSNDAAPGTPAPDFSALLSSLQSKNEEKAPKSESAQQAEIEEEPADEKRDQVESKIPDVMVAPLPNPAPPNPIPIELCEKDDPKRVSPVSLAEITITVESPATESRTNLKVAWDATDNSNNATIAPSEAQVGQGPVSLVEEKNAQATTEASAGTDKSERPEATGQIPIAEERTQQFASEGIHESGTKSVKRVGAPLKLWGGRLPMQGDEPSDVDSASNGSEDVPNERGNEGKESQGVSNEQRPRVVSRQAVESSVRKSVQVEGRSKGRESISSFDDKPHKESAQSVEAPNAELNSTTPPPKIMDGGLEQATAKETRQSPMHVEIPKAEADDASLQRHAEGFQRVNAVDRLETSAVAVAGANHLLTRVEHHEMRFGWESPEFGRLEVRTTVERDRVGASIVSSDTRVREFLRDDAASLSNALATHSLHLENFHTMDSPTHSNQEHGGQESQPSERRLVQVLEKSALSRRHWESRHAGALDLHA